MAIFEFVRDLGSNVTMLLLVTAGIYLTGAVIIGSLKDRKHRFERIYVQPADLPSADRFR